jgi:hypothetical protein
MNQNVQFVRETINRAKELGMSCLIMADGAYGFTGDLSQILGEQNGALLGETYWEPSDDSKTITFEDLDGLNKEAWAGQLIGPKETTRLEHDLGVNFVMYVADNGAEFVVLTYDENTITPVLYISWEDNGDIILGVYPEPDKQKLLDTHLASTDTIITSLAKINTADLPSLVGNAAGHFLCCLIEAAADGFVTAHGYVSADHYIPGYDPSYETLINTVEAKAKNGVVWIDPPDGDGDNARNIQWYDSGVQMNFRVTSDTGIKVYGAITIDRDTQEIRLIPVTDQCVAQFEKGSPAIDVSKTIVLDELAEYFGIENAAEINGMIRNITNMI